MEGLWQSVRGGRGPWLWFGSLEQGRVSHEDEWGARRSVEASIQ